MGKKGGGLYQNWLRNFAINIFTQSFHAIFLMFIIQMLVALQGIKPTDGSNSDGIVAIMSIVGMMAIIKFEKLLKKLFGMEDSLSGDLKGAGAKMIMGLKAGSDLGKEISKPYKDLSTSNKSRKAAGRAAGVSESKIGFGSLKGQYINSDKKRGLFEKAENGISSTASGLSSAARGVYDNLKSNKGAAAEVTVTDSKKSVDQAKNQEIVVDNKVLTEVEVGDKIAESTGRYADSRSTKIEKTQKEKEDEYNDAELEFRKNKRKAKWNTAGNIAALAMGFGATDEISEGLTAANIINNPINSVTNRYVDHGENITAFKDTGNEKYFERSLSQAIKDGFKEAGTSASDRDSGNIGKNNQSAVKLTVNAAVNYATMPLQVAKLAFKSSKQSNINNVDDL